MWWKWAIVTNVLEIKMLITYSDRQPWTMSALIELSGFQIFLKKGHKVWGVVAQRDGILRGFSRKCEWSKYICIHIWNSHRIIKIYLKIKCGNCLKEVDKFLKVSLKSNHLNMQKKVAKFSKAKHSFK